MAVPESTARVEPLPCPIDKVSAPATEQNRYTSPAPEGDGSSDATTSSTALAN